MATSQAPLPDAIDDSSLLTKYPGQFKALGPYELSGFKKGAPIKAIEVIKKTYNINIAKGLEIERKVFGELASSDISKNLVQLFFLPVFQPQDRCQLLDLQNS